MDYRALVFLHLLGAVMLGSALISGQMHQYRARSSRDVRFIAETYRSLFLTVAPFAPAGGATLLASGTALIYSTGARIEGWLAALLLLFAFEMVEGITHYLPHARKLMDLSREALAKGEITPELDRAMNGRLENFLLYLDIPNFLAIVALAVFKPF